MSKKIIQVVEYNCDWPKNFEIFAREIKDVLKENCTKIYHVGSTSVPGLCAKPVIDIMCVVNNLKTAEESLTKIGYKSKGEFNLPLRLFFDRKTPINTHIHVVKENSGEISWNLIFQDYLRKNKNAREMYANTKLNLIKNNPDGFDIVEGLFSEYTIKKSEIIRQIAKEAGFSDYRFVIVSNDYEAKMCKKILRTDNLYLDYKQAVCLCLYKGTEITAATILRFLGHEIGDFNSVTISEIGGLDENSKIMLWNKMTEWFKFKNIKEIIIEDKNICALKDLIKNNKDFKFIFNNI